MQPETVLQKRQAMYQHKNRQKVSGQVFCGQMRPLFSWFLGKKKDVWFRMPKMRKTISAVIGERCKIQRCHGLGNLLICEAAEIFVKDSLAEILQLVSYVPEQLKHAVKNKVDVTQCETCLCPNFKSIFHCKGQNTSLITQT